MNVRLIKWDELWKLLFDLLRVAEAKIRNEGLCVPVRHICIKEL